MDCYSYSYLTIFGNFEVRLCKLNRFLMIIKKFFFFLNMFNWQVKLPTPRASEGGGELVKRAQFSKREKRNIGCVNAVTLDPAS